jgi:RNA polymerase sigma-70 factor (ECF subfamily)
MAEPNTFADFIRRIRAGDARAAEDLVRRYEPLIRREVRLNLEDRRLGRVFDSMDVCQSVLKSFFIRTAAGQYDLDDPAQLVRLLVAMVRNKLASAARREHRQKRDQRRATANEEALAGIVAAGPTPSRMIEGCDLVAQVRARMSEEERRLADLRGQDLTWEEIALRLGGAAQARRVQFSRALDRVAQELNIDEAGDE